MSMLEIENSKSDHMKVVWILTETIKFNSYELIPCFDGPSYVSQWSDIDVYWVPLQSHETNDFLLLDGCSVYFIVKSALSWLLKHEIDW